MFARFLVACALAAATLPAWAQSWSLVNRSNQTLKFETYEPARGSWQAQTIYPNQPVTYSMASPTGKFRIATQGRGHVEYQVQAGGQYSLQWDTQKQVWDLKTAQGGNASPAPAAAAGATWNLRNSSNQTITFETLDPARGTWKTQTVYPNESKNYSFQPGTSAGKIRVGTQGRGFVEYDVRAGWKYNLLWDQAKGVWDLRTLQRAS